MDPKGEGNIILRHVTNHSPKETGPHPRGLESSTTPMRKHHISRYPGGNKTGNVRTRSVRVTPVTLEWQYVLHILRVSEA